MSLPPHQSFRVYTQNKRLVILSVSETGLAIGDGTPYPTFNITDYSQGVFLFSQKLTITSDIQAPFGLTVSTTKLSIPGANPTRYLDVTGIEGEDDEDTPVIDGDDPRIAPSLNGKHGSALGLYIHDLDDAAAFALSRRAQGGRGGNTYKKDGVAGDGGQGGSIISVLRPTYLPLLEFAEKYRDYAEFHPADRVKAVTPEDPIYHGAMAVLEMAKTVSAPQDMINSIFSELSTTLAKIRDNTEPCTALQVKLALVNGNSTDTGITMIRNFITKQFNQLAPKFDNYRGGYGGRGVNVDVTAGTTGTAGQEEQTFMHDSKTRWSAELAKQRLPFAHPEHCAMLLERADIFFYINSPLMRSHAQKLYQQLIDLLSFLPLQPSDPLYEAYEKSPIMPPSSLADLASIHTSASRQLVALASGEVDYNGYAPQWVPRGSYTFYKRDLDDALVNLRLFEEAYTKYHVALVNQEDLINKVKLATENLSMAMVKWTPEYRNAVKDKENLVDKVKLGDKDLNDKVELAHKNTSRMVSSLNGDQTDLRLLLQDLDRNIAAMAFDVKDAQKDLKDAYDAVNEQLKKSFGLHVSQVINLFTRVSVSPVGIVVKDVIRRGFDAADKVPTISGFDATKEYLASEIKKSEASIKRIAELLGDKLESEFQLDDPFATRLVVKKKEILAELKKFSRETFGGISTADVRKNLETKFDAFIDTVTKRNGLILRYNTNIDLLQESIKKARGYEAERQKLVSRQISHYDSDLPQITAYMASIYQSSRARVMKLLNLLLRSLNFRMLESYDVINFLFKPVGRGGFQSEATIDNVPLTLTADVMQAARDEIEEKFRKSIERWGSEPAKFPEDFDHGEGKQYFLNKSQQSQLLTSKEHKVVVPISVDAGGNFGRSCNLRIYRVRFGFTGLRTSTTVLPGESVFVQMTLTHGGHDTIMDDSNNAFSFDHDRVSTLYSFRLKPDGSSEVLSNGNVGQLDVNATETSYAAPGPFTDWTISLKWTHRAKGGAETDWEGLDMSQVDGAYLDFVGTNYACVASSSSSS